MLDDLPFLVVHGAVLAKLAVVVLAAVGGVMIAGVRWRMERTKMRYAVGGRAEALTGLAAGYVSLRGRLRGTACTLGEDDGLFQDIGYGRSEVLFVEVAGERIQLVGDVQVIRGSKATTGWRKMPAGTPAAIAKDRAPARRRLFSVADGDEVVVQGTLERAGDGTASYREAGIGWTLRAMSNLPAIEVVAVEPVTVPMALGPVRMAIWALVALVASYGALRQTGSILLEHGADDDGPVLGVRSQLAAALPGSRDKAIRNMWWQLRDKPHTAAMLSQELALTELKDGCAGRGDWLVDHERYEDVLATVHGCAPDAEIRALARLGRYAEAAALLAQHPEALVKDLREQVAVEIGAGRWADAAAAAERVAQELEAESMPTGALLELHKRRLGQVRCVAEWFRLEGGDAVAGARLAQLALTSDAPACGLAAALQLPAEQRPLALADVHAKDRYGDQGRLAEALIWLDTGDEDDASISVRFLASGIDPWTWLVPFASHGSADAPARQSSLHARRALYALFTGALETALSEARTVTTDTRNDLVAALELHTAKTPIVWTEPRYRDDRMARQIAVRNGELRDEPYLISACDQGLAAGMRSAITGDGLRLATAITAACDQRSGVVERLLGVAPRITAHRAELAEALRLYSDHAYLRDELPFQFVIDAAFRRDLLRLVGQAADAERWQARVTGQLQVLSDRNRLMGFLLWAL